MICPECGQDHANQFTDYPDNAVVVVTGDFDGGIDPAQFDPRKYPRGEGAPRLLIPAGSLGRVIGHCDDGRALIEFEAEAGKSKASHSFHYPETYFMVALGEVKAA